MRNWGQRSLSIHFAFAMHINWFHGPYALARPRAKTNKSLFLSASVKVFAAAVAGLLALQFLFALAVRNLGLHKISLTIFS